MCLPRVPEVSNTPTLLSTPNIQNFGSGVIFTYRNQSHGEIADSKLKHVSTKCV